MANPRIIEKIVKRVRNRKAFIDVPNLARRFYTDYAAAFEKAERLIAGQKELKGNDLRIYTQTLFNRLMFLRFIECKGWLDFGGRNDYLRALYAAGGYRKKSFYRGRLCPLFFAGLSVEGKQHSPAYGRVPYFEGGKGVRHLLCAAPGGPFRQKVPDPFSAQSRIGLFERSGLDERVTDLPDEVFAGILGGEPPGGLFYRYRFTVAESTPLDAEAAVDPEMLGRVFEELVTRRHETGAYYTPRTVVSFMCRETLKGYLSNRTGVSATAVARLVDRQDAGKLNATDARQIVAALDDLKAVDPACGSGAYLLGLLREMMALYRLLYGRTREERKEERGEGNSHSERSGHSERSEESGSNANAGQILRCAQNDGARGAQNDGARGAQNDGARGDCPSFRQKRRIVSRSLYGLDIDPLATDIARLRLWLSLATDADEPGALRNPDFKIDSGDALLVDWPSRFAEAFAGGRGGFDIVLANPPYQNMFSQTRPGRRKGGQAPFVRSALPAVPAKGARPLFRPAYRTAIRKAFETARGGFDIFVPFMELGIQILRDHGMLAYITPNKLLSAKYAETLRTYLDSHAQLRSLADLSGVPVFGAAVYPVITVAMKKGSGTFCANGNLLCEAPGGPFRQKVPDPFFRSVDVFTADNGPSGRLKLRRVHRAAMPLARPTGRSWSLFVDPDSSRLRAALDADWTLADVAAVSASATVDEAYRWKPAISEEKGDCPPLCEAPSGPFRQMGTVPFFRVDRERYVPFVVSGNIRPHHHTWETRSVRYLNRVYQRPVIDGRHPSVSPRRYAQMQAPKIIASGMAKRPTCAWVAEPIATGVATVLVIPKEEIDGAYLAAVINSTTMQRLYRVLFGSLSLAGGYLRFGAPQFKLLPVPPASRAEQRIIARLVESGSGRGAPMDAAVLGEIDERVARLYGVKP